MSKYLGFIYFEYLYAFIYPMALSHLPFLIKY